MLFKPLAVLCWTAPMLLKYPANTGAGKNLDS